MTSIRKPKLRRYPKAPKSNSLETLKRYTHKVSEVRKINDGLMAEYHKKVKERAALKKEVENLRKKATTLKGMGAVHHKHKK